MCLSKIGLKWPMRCRTVLIYTEFNVLSIEEIHKYNLLNYIHKNYKHLKGKVYYVHTRKQASFIRLNEKKSYMLRKKS